MDPNNNQNDSSPTSPVDNTAASSDMSSFGSQVPSLPAEDPGSLPVNPPTPSSDISDMGGMVSTTPLGSAVGGDSLQSSPQTSATDGSMSSVQTPTDPLTAIGSTPTTGLQGENIDQSIKDPMGSMGGSFIPGMDTSLNGTTDSNGLGSGAGQVNTLGNPSIGGDTQDGFSNMQDNSGTFPPSNLNSSTDNLSQSQLSSNVLAQSFPAGANPNGTIPNQTVQTPTGMEPAGVNSPFGAMPQNVDNTALSSNFGIPNSNPSLGSSGNMTGNIAGDSGVQSNISLTEAAPTDLSHLIDPSQSTPPTQPPINPSAVAQTENLIVPTPQAGVEAPTTNSSAGFPKWLFAVGAVLLLLVAGSSAYFILGIGKAKVSPVSQTAQPPLTTPSKPLTIVTPTPMETNTASSSASFGGVIGSPSPTSVSSSSATSALQILKNRNNSTQSGTNP